MNQVPGDEKQVAVNSNSDLSSAQISGPLPQAVPTTPSLADSTLPSFISPASQYRGKSTTIIAAILAILLTFSGSLLGTITYNNHQYTLATTATAAAYATHVSLKKTAIVQATATARAVSVIGSYPFSTHLFLNDPLTDGSSAAKYGWDVGKVCTFTNGTYEVTEPDKNFIQPCTANNTNFTNFTYEVQMTIVAGGDQATGGVYFRADMKTGKLYLFELDTQGNYTLSVRTSSSGASSRTLKSGTISSFVTGFNQTHTIGIVANRSQFLVYIDHSLITQATDPTYISGAIGVISEYGSTTTVVDYNDAKVWLLS